MAKTKKVKRALGKTRRFLKRVTKAAPVAGISNVDVSHIIVARLNGWTLDRLAAAFTEWDRQYRANPGAFMTEVDHLLNTTPKTYGELCAAQLVRMLDATVASGAVAPEGTRTPQVGR